MYFKDFHFLLVKKFCISESQHQHKQNATALKDDEWHYMQLAGRKYSTL